MQAIPSPQVRGHPTSLLGSGVYHVNIPVPEDRLIEATRYGPVGVSKVVVRKYGLAGMSFVIVILCV